MTIQIDNDNAEVRRFLTELGCADADMQDGELDFYELETRGLDYFALELTSQLHISDVAITVRHTQLQWPESSFCPNQTYSDMLTEDDLVPLKNHFGEANIHYLFADWNNDAGSLYATWNLVLLANELGVMLLCDDFAGLEVPAVIPEEVSVGALAIHGIHLTDDLVEPKLREAGKAVYQLVIQNDPNFQDGSGSATAVSPYGDFYTAKHCLFDNDGRFRKNLAVIVDGREYRITKRDIVTIDDSLDFVSFKIRRLDTPHYLEPLCDAAVPGQNVVHVGYAKAPRYEGRRYSFGHITTPEQLAVDMELYHDRDMNPYLWSDALLAGGYSGGAIVDADTGCLIGINTDRAYKKYGKTRTTAGSAGVPVFQLP